MADLGAVESRNFEFLLACVRRAPGLKSERGRQRDPTIELRKNNVYECQSLSGRKLELAYLDVGRPDVVGTEQLPYDLDRISNSAPAGSMLFA